MVPLNSASGGFAYIWQSKKGGIIAINNEGTQIHFLSDVLVTAASLDLKVPIAGAERGRTRSGYRILQKLKASMLILSFVACDGRLHLHFMKIIGPLMISWFLDIGIQRVLGTKDDSTAAACLQSLLSLARFWRTRERLCMTRVTSLLSMTVGLSLNGCSHSKNHFDERKQGWLVKDLWTAAASKLEAIQVVSFSQEIKTRLCLQGGTSNSSLRKRVIAWDPK